MMWNSGMGWTGWLFMALTTVAFWGLVIFAVIALFRGTRNDAEPERRVVTRDPGQILDERFARGEIDADEYHTRQDVLRAAH